jgi:hypothetical protein
MLRSAAEFRGAATRFLREVLAGVYGRAMPEPSEPQSAVIVDLDGTLCDVSTILHFVEGDEKDFPAFHTASAECPPDDNRPPPDGNNPPPPGGRGPARAGLVAGPVAHTIPG